MALFPSGDSRQRIPFQLLWALSNVSEVVRGRKVLLIRRSEQLIGRAHSGWLSQLFQIHPRIVFKWCWILSILEWDTTNPLSGTCSQGFQEEIRGYSIWTSAYRRRS
jgi:hypothetical protein